MDFRNHRLRALIPELYLLSELEYFDLLTSVQEYRVPRCGLLLSHLPRQLVLPSLQQSGFRRIPAKYLMARPGCNN